MREKIHLLILMASLMFIPSCATMGFYDLDSAYHPRHYPVYYDPMTYYTSTYLREYDYQMRSKLRNKARENARRDARHLIDRIFK